MLIQNFLRSWRLISTKPWFSIAVIVMLAAGVAGSTAVFSVFNSLFLRSLPFAQSDRLIDLDETAPQWNLVHVGVANPDLYQWRTQNSTFESMAFFRTPSCNLSVGNTSERVVSAQVTREMLQVLRLRPLLGRNFSRDEDRPGGTAVTLLSFGLWQRKFAGSRDVLGDVIKIDDRSYTVIGVLPREAVFPDRVELWTPLAPDPNANTGYYANGVGRLKSGISLQQAQTDLLRIHKAMIAQGRSINGITSPLLMPLRDRYLGDWKSVSRVLLVAVGMLLLIACVNIASLMMVHSASRNRELWIRSALGASRGSIALQLFVESIALACIGGAIGILAGAVAVHAMQPILASKLPGWISFSVDWRVMLFSLAITCAATVIFGSLPALQNSRVEVGVSSQDVGTRTTFSRRQRATLNAFVACEIGLALMLAVSAGLLVRAFQKVMHVDPGFQPENVLTFAVSLPDTAYQGPEQKIAYFDRMLERLQALPGVNAVGATSSPPLGGQWGGVFQAQGGRAYDAQGDNPTVSQVAVTPGYFRALGMTLLDGRVFQREDGEPTPRLVAMVNETFAKYFWNGQSPVGRRIRRIGSSDWLDVVGVLRDEKHYGLDHAVLPSVFLPYSTAMATSQRGDERALQEMSIVLRSAIAPSTLIDPVRETLRQLDPNVPMYAVQTMTQTLDASLWTRRAYSWLFVLFAVIAISLGAAGLYATVSYGVGQRRKEIGVRMALGARPKQVLTHVLTGGMRTVLLGVTAGVMGALGATNWLRTLLFEVNSRDPLIYCAAAVCVIAVALLATIIPARRAARIDPMVALRYE